MHFYIFLFSAHGLKILVQKTHQKGVLNSFSSEKNSKWESKLGDFWTACNVSTTLAKWYLSTDGSYLPQVHLNRISIPGFKHLRSLMLDLWLTHGTTTAPYPLHSAFWLVENFISTNQKDALIVKQGSRHSCILFWIFQADH